MSDRFASEKAAFLDRDRDAALNNDRLAQAPAEQPNAAKSPEKWELAKVARLMKEETASPVMLRASAMLVAVKEGQQLCRDLSAITAKGVLIRVEAFDSEAALLVRRNELTHTDARSSDTSTVNGHTDPFRVRGVFVFDLDEKTNKPRGFHVLIRVRGARVADMKRGAREAAFDAFETARTLHHELLHVHYMYTRVDFENETTRSSTKDGFLFESFDEGPSTTGHGSCTFTLNPSTLRMEIDGDVDAEFRRRLSVFVDEVVAKFALRSGVGEVHREGEGGSAVKR